MQVLNPLDAICHKPRVEAICVSQLRNAKKIDEALLQERPDVKIFLPFRFLFYKPEELFIPHTYNKFLGRELLGNDKAYVTESVLDEPSVKFENYQPFFEFSQLPLVVSTLLAWWTKFPTQQHQHPPYPNSRIYLQTSSAMETTGHQIVERTANVPTPLTSH